MPNAGYRVSGMVVTMTANGLALGAVVDRRDCVRSVKIDKNAKDKTRVFRLVNNSA
jgi:hypothetical protein